MSRDIVCLVFVLDILQLFFRSRKRIERSGANGSVVLTFVVEFPARVIDVTDHRCVGSFRFFRRAVRRIQVWMTFRPVWIFFRHCVASGFALKGAHAGSVWVARSRLKNQHTSSGRQNAGSTLPQRLLCRSQWRLRDPMRPPALG